MRAPPPHPQRLLELLGETCATGGGRGHDAAIEQSGPRFLLSQTGRLGCSHCYVTFEGNLRGLLRRLHGSVQHVGKVYLPPDPTRAEQQERLAGLRRKLDKAVELEDFERAAQIRDMIRTLEGAL